MSCDSQGPFAHGDDPIFSAGATSRRSVPDSDLCEGTDVVTRLNRHTISASGHSPYYRSHSDPSINIGSSTRIGDYIVGAIIGYSDGNVPSVFEATHVETGKMIALKRLDLEKLENNTVRNDVDRLEEWRDTLCFAASLRHANLLTYQGSHVKNGELWIEMSLLQGSCKHLMTYLFRTGFPESVVAAIVKEAVRALAYMHSRNGVHRSIKAGNVLLGDDGSVKLGGFEDAASLIRNGSRRGNLHSYSTSGRMLAWTAPEAVAQSAVGYTTKADIYSIGILALELIFGEAPYSNLPPAHIFLLKLTKPSPTFDDYVNAGYGAKVTKFSKGFKEFIEQTLSVNPNDRPTAAKLLDHPFFRQVRKNRNAVKQIFYPSLPRLPVRERVCRQVLNNERANKILEALNQTSGQIDPGSENGEQPQSEWSRSEQGSISDKPKFYLNTASSATEHDGDHVH